MGEPATLVCIGNLTVDEAISPEGLRTVSAGGDALFAALAARLAGGRPRVLAPIGADAPEELVAALRLAGTDPTLLPRRSRPTVRNEVVYADDGTRRWTLVNGEEHFEAMSVTPADVPRDVLAADGILLSAMALGPQLELAAWLRPRTAAVIYFDPQEDYCAGHEDALLDAVAACDVFLPSEFEAVALAGTADAAAAARRFLDLGPRLVVVKRAERGCLVVTGDGWVAVPAEPATVVDATGAGDAFCGAFAAAHLASGDPLAAARAGAVAARAAVSGPGVSGLVAVLTTPAGGR